MSGKWCPNTTSHSRRLTSCDAGFTLVELILTIAILGVITVPLGNTVIAALRNHQATSDRMELSHDAQISAAYFAHDVATVGVRDYATTPPPNSGPPYRQSIQLDAAHDAGGAVCGTAATPTAKLRLLSDRWSGGVSATVGTDVVAYYLAGSELHRIKCSGSATPADDLVLAHHVDPATLAVTCSSACEAAAVPQHVTLSFSVTLPSVGAYPITLNGQRRQ
ncbi:MAG TPA: type II secretion system protein, partial [Pseudonocardiaceae bacterium]